MNEIEQLKILFDDINKLKGKSSMNTCQFCSELTKSDDDEYLELHFSLLEEKKKYFQSDLKLYFTFRQNREQVHYFLKGKLQNLSDEQLKNDVIEILDDLSYSSLDDLRQWIDDIKTGIRNDKNQFVYSIMKSPFVEYHYQLLNDPELDEKFRNHLKNRFEEHKEDGELLLLSKLDNNQDADFHAEIIFMLGCIRGKSKAKTLEFARKLSESENDYTRDRALIVLGWVGTIDDTEILEKHLLNDTNVHCRAWSASSYSQMWFRRKSESLKQKAFIACQKALQNESDYFVISVILSAIRDIGNTKLGISQSALDDLDVEKIDIAKTKAIRFLNKATENNE